MVVSLRFCMINTPSFSRENILNLFDWVVAAYSIFLLRSRAGGCARLLLILLAVALLHVSIDQSAIKKVVIFLFFFLFTFPHSFILSEHRLTLEHTLRNLDPILLLFCKIFRL